MAIGVYCENCKHKELEPKFDKWPCMDCCDGDRRDPFTNADRIRAMSDEELAEFLNTVNTVFCSCAMGKSPCRAENCPCWLEWLKEEATDVN